MYLFILYYIPFTFPVHPTKTTDQIIDWLIDWLTDILLMANQSSLNVSEADQDVGERERKMREVEAMLREMRHRSSATQKKMADREKTEAEKCNDDPQTQNFSLYTGGIKVHHHTILELRTDQDQPICFYQSRYWLLVIKETDNWYLEPIYLKSFNVKAQNKW